MAKHGLSQTRLAEQARVSQSTVSRALRRVPDRHSQARFRLSNFTHITESTFEDRAKGGIKQVVDAFDEIWDGSKAHAEAVANVIEALAGLRPAGSRRRRKRS
jgi:transcriptional regulator with XRE-family HTH domain